MLANEHIGPLLFKMSAPAIIGMVVHGLYNVVDAIFVSRYVGTLGIGATAIAFPLQMITMSLGISIGIGGASIISRRMGEQDHEGASLALGITIILSLGFGLICLALGSLALSPLLRAFGATATIMPYAKVYMFYILIGTPMAIFSIAVSSAVRAEGNAAVAMNSMIIGSVLNIVLDPVFIIVLKMGIKGAALATVISMTVSALYLVSYLMSGKSELSLGVRYLRLKGPMVFETLSVGSSEFIRMAAMSLTVGLFNNILGKIGGDIPIAAFGIVFRLISFIIMPIVGIALGAQPIIGFNFGAGNEQRVKRGFKLATQSTTAFAFFGFFLFLVIPETCAKLFTKDPELIAATTQALRLMALGLPLVGYQGIATSLYQALGRARPALFLALSRQVLFLVPMALLLPHIFGLTGVWLAFPAADVIAFFVAFAMVAHTLRRLKPVEVGSETTP